MMFSSIIQKYKWNQVTMGGDLFLLSIPFQPELWNLARLWRENKLSKWYAPDEDELIISVNGNDSTLWGTSRWSREDRSPFLHETAEWTMYYFRPSLIPLNRDGSYDKEFHQIVPYGSIVRGGTLTQNGEPRSSTALLKETKLTLEEKGKGLFWASTGYSLICTQPWSRGNIRTLRKTGVIPELKSGDTKKT